jgi:hypothetical protein
MGWAESTSARMAAVYTCGAEPALAQEPPVPYVARSWQRAPALIEALLRSPAARKAHRAHQRAEGSPMA